MHKHFTDPTKKDTDGDGKPDGDADERREFAYTVAATVTVMPPVDEASLTDDFQDGKVVKRGADFVVIDVVLYPFNTVNDDIGEDDAWRSHVAPWKRFVEPGPTSNWDAAMQRELIAALAKDGIDAKKAGDRTLAAQASDWLLKNSKFEDSFTTFAFEFPGGKARVARELEKNVDEGLAKTKRTLEEQTNRELYGKGMFENRIHGTCTSTAIYVQTVLRALGLPARTIVVVPLLDASDKSERALLDGVTHPRMRKFLEAACDDRGDSWASHTFNEVFVAGRWRRLNYQKLGQNIRGDSLGLMVHVNTFRDHAEAGLVKWGIRAASDHTDRFGHSNPYSCEALSDRFGAHVALKAPPPDAEMKEAVVDRVYWYFDGEKSGRVKMNLDDRESAGHLVMHVDTSCLPSRAEIERVLERASHAFVLRANGQQDVPLAHERGGWIDVGSDLADLYLKIAPGDFPKMEKNVAYRLEAVESDGEYRFRVAPGVTITRASAVGP